MKRPEITGQVTFIYTEELGSTSAFYRDILELEMVVDQGCCHIYQTGPSSFIGVCEISERPKNPVGVMLTVVTPEVDRFYAHLLAKGITFERPPTLSERFNVYSCLFKGPDGYSIEIQEFKDPDWPL